MEEVMTQGKVSSSPSSHFLHLSIGVSEARRRGPQSGNSEAEVLRPKVRVVLPPVSESPTFIVHTLVTYPHPCGNMGFISCPGPALRPCSRGGARTPPQSQQG